MKRRNFLKQTPVVLALGSIASTSVFNSLSANAAKPETKKDVLKSLRQDRKMLTWDKIREPFSVETFPVARAICERGGYSDAKIVTLAGLHDHGYAANLDQFTNPFHDPDVTMQWVSRFHGHTRGIEKSPALIDEPSFLSGTFSPDRIERQLLYPSVGLTVEEDCLRCVDGRYSWDMNWFRDAYRPFAPRWKKKAIPLPFIAYLNIDFQVPCNVKLATDGVSLIIEHPEKQKGIFYLTIGGDANMLDCLIAEEHQLRSLEIDLFNDNSASVWSAAGISSISTGSNVLVRSVIIPVKFSILPQQRCRIGIAFGFGMPPKDISSLADEKSHSEEIEKVRGNWDNWIASFQEPTIPEVLPTLVQQLSGSASSEMPTTYIDSNGINQFQKVRTVIRPLQELTQDDYRLAYAKCLSLTRLCERKDPVWGLSLTESFTTYYSGTFVWSMPVVGFYTRRQPDVNFRNGMRDILDSYKNMQAKDGSLPCFISFGMPRPTKQVESHGTTQQPQFAWTVWQEYQGNKDKKWLAEWIDPLLRLQAAMDKRDSYNLKLGLWCQLHYYDGLDVFPTVDGLVLRDEPVLYSSAYAAEQVRFYQTMSLIFAELGDKRVGEFSTEAKVVHQRMIKLLWDEKRQWFGDILADGSRETVVGMQGLFAGAYGLFPEHTDKIKLRRNIEALIAPFGCTTVATEDRRFTEHFFWRGPVWPASCLYTAATALIYAPDLLPRIAAACVRFALAQPNIWECIEGHTGAVATYDEGFSVMPGESSVVGSYAIVAALDIALGKTDLFKI